MPRRSEAQDAFWHWRCLAAEHRAAEWLFKHSAFFRWQCRYATRPPPLRQPHLLTIPFLRWSNRAADAPPWLEQRRSSHSHHSRRARRSAFVAWRHRAQVQGSMRPREALQTAVPWGAATAHAAACFGGSHTSFRLPDSVESRGSASCASCVGCEALPPLASGSSCVASPVVRGERVPAERRVLPQAEVRGVPCGGVPCGGVPSASSAAKPHAQLLSGDGCRAHRLPLWSAVLRWRRATRRLQHAQRRTAVARLQHARSLLMLWQRRHARVSTLSRAPLLAWDGAARRVLATWRCQVLSRAARRGRDECAAAHFMRRRLLAWGRTSARRWLGAFRPSPPPSSSPTDGRGIPRARHSPVLSATAAAAPSAPSTASAAASAASRREPASRAFSSPRVMQSVSERGRRRLRTLEAMRSRALRRWVRRWAGGASAAAQWVLALALAARHDARRVRRRHLRRWAAAARAVALASSRQHDARALWLRRRLGAMRVAVEAREIASSRRRRVESLMLLCVVGRLVGALRAWRVDASSRRAMCLAAHCGSHAALSTALWRWWDWGSSRGRRPTEAAATAAVWWRVSLLCPALHAWAWAASERRTTTLGLFLCWHTRVTLAWQRWRRCLLETADVPSPCATEGWELD